MRRRRETNERKKRTKEKVVKMEEWREGWRSRGKVREVKEWMER